MVWGTEASTTAESVPLRTAVSRHDDGWWRHFAWATDDLPLHARFRLDWRFRAAANNQQQTKETR
ncbi:hypothetical protein [Kitasatospora sp. NPDC097691]|uniref:hypothetical protein n=1 Tax=Kitasatospora sp. NPDC097691 TaxID=3157231 RepID=UPI00331CC3F4